MPEQNVNIHPEQVFYRTFAKLCCLAFALLALVMSACVPTGEEDVNTSLFKDKEDLKLRTSALRPGADKQAVFDALGVTPSKFSRMSLSEVQASVYGNSQVQGTPEQLEKFREHMMAYEGYSLPYRSVRSDGSLVGFGTMKIHKSGEDMKLVLIFEHNKLMRAAVEGTEEVSQDDNQGLFSILIQKGVGMAP